MFPMINTIGKINLDGERVHVAYSSQSIMKGSQGRNLNGTGTGRQELK